MVLSPKLAYTPGGTFATGTLNAFDVNVVINGATVEHDGTGLFGFAGRLDTGMGHGSRDGGGHFTNDPTISWFGGLSFTLGGSTDALNGASFNWQNFGVPFASCISSFVPNTSGSVDFCQVAGTSVVPEPSAATLAILGAAMLVAWRMLEKRQLLKRKRRPKALVYP
jgi:hypothetical protein